MPEKGWYSLTVRKNTADKIRELAKNEDLTVDKYLNQIIDTKQPNTTPNNTKHTGQIQKMWCHGEE